MHAYALQSATKKTKNPSVRDKKGEAESKENLFVVGEMKSGINRSCT